MQLKVFLKLKKPKKLSLLGKYMYKKKTKKTTATGLVFFLKTKFFPTLLKSSQCSTLS
jgi:hypothetical protein